MRNRNPKGTWEIRDTYIDIETGFHLTETTRSYGTLMEVMEGYAYHNNTFDLRFIAYSADDQTS